MPRAGSTGGVCVWARLVALSMVETSLVVQPVLLVGYVSYPT